MLSAKILDGKKLAQSIKQSLKESLIRHDLTNKITLAVILVGEDPASKVYVKNKNAACEYVGINVKNYHLDHNSTLDDLLRIIDLLNNDEHTHGILLQLPLPDNIIKNSRNNHTSSYIIERIASNKDVDGFHPYNMGRLATRSPTIVPCTPLGVHRLLEHYNIPVKSKNLTIIGASNIVGRPIALDALITGATVTICHKFTTNLQEHCLNADILCSAVGIPKLIPGDYIKQGATVIDIGITRLPDGSLSGDVDFMSAKEKASYITPVPGGIGPMTVAMLIENTIKCYELLTSNKVIN